MTFPISEKQFLAWLDANPKQRCGRQDGTHCPLFCAVNEITEERPLLGIKDWCLPSDLVFGGDQNRQYPKWAQRVVDISDNLGWAVYKKQLKEALK